MKLCGNALNNRFQRIIIARVQKFINVSNHTFTQTRPNFNEKLISAKPVWDYQLARIGECNDTMMKHEAEQVIARDIMNSN